MPKTQPPPRPADLLPAVIAAVEHAGSVLRAEFHRPGGPRRDGDKAPIDAELEWLLRERLLAAHDCAWLGEETAARGSLAGDAWVVDPLDGTAAFLDGRRGSAVSVALLRSYQPVLGVVLAPLAFTEHGSIMAATILNSPRAVQMSVYVVRAFVELRAAAASNAALARKLEALEKSVAALDSGTRQRFDQVYEAILGLMNPGIRRQ